MRICYIRLTAILAVLFFALGSSSGVFAYQVQQDTGMKGANDRYWEHRRGEIDGPEMSNQPTNPTQPNIYNYPDGGNIQKGGTGGGGGLFLGNFQRPMGDVQTQMYTPPGQRPNPSPEWFNHREGPIDGPVPRGAIFLHEQNYPIQTDAPTPQQQVNIDRANRAGGSWPGGLESFQDRAMNAANGAGTAADLANAPENKSQQGMNQMQGAAQGASEALADAFDPTWIAMLELQTQPLINVANEASGSPASAYQPVKSHQNAVWFVQQMYHAVYIPMAVLLLLPGAVLTQMKGYVSFGIMGSSGEDSSSPFAGILRAMIAVFLIPATQLVLSYCIDVGNSMTYEVSRYVNPLTIFMWADEQVFRAPLENAKNQVTNPSNFPVLGKLSQGAEQLSGLESQSAATIMLQLLANGMAESAAFGLVMLCAFQITFICYLLLLGPIAAALYAWPSGIGQLFNRVFTVWVDAAINLSLWKFWWTVVLLCIDTRLGWLGALGGFSIYSEWELLMFIAFLVILTYVPFNPFDFKAGEMVSKVMQIADQAVGEATQGK